VEEYLQLNHAEKTPPQHGNQQDVSTSPCTGRSKRQASPFS